MSSILTNHSSMVALQTLKQINNDLGKVQSEVATGLRVSTAADDSSSWSIASTMKSDVATFSKLSEGLTSASAMVGVARAAAEQISEILVQIQEKVVQGQDPSADTGKLDAEITEMINTIDSIADAAQFNGVNLVGTGAANVNVTVAIQRDAAGALTDDTFAVTATVLNGVAAGVSTASTTDAIDTLLDTVNAAAATFGAAQARIDAQNSFLGKQVDALTTGVGALVDADMEAASARLTALQTQQQLGTQALAIANQAPQTILSLFK